MLTDATGGPKVIFDVQKLIEKMPNLPRYTKEVPVKCIFLHKNMYIGSSIFIFWVV